jgi:hypothetical protein
LEGNEDLTDTENVTGAASRRLHQKISDRHAALIEKGLHLYIMITKNSILIQGMLRKRFAPACRPGILCDE